LSTLPGCQSGSPDRDLHGALAPTSTPPASAIQACHCGDATDVVCRQRAGPGAAVLGAWRRGYFDVVGTEGARLLRTRDHLRTARWPCSPDAVAPVVWRRHQSAFITVGGRPVHRRRGGGPLPERQNVRRGAELWWRRHGRPAGCRQTGRGQTPAGRRPPPVFARRSCQSVSDASGRP
jgi:hypothetical protein